MGTVTLARHFAAFWLARGPRVLARHEPQRIMDTRAFVRSCALVMRFYSRASALLACAALVATSMQFSGCGFEPSAAKMEFALAPRTHEALAEGLTERARLLHELEARFGTPRAPRYALLAQWEQDRYDPNHPELARGARGSGEFDAAALEALRSENRSTFARELAALARGNFKAVEPRASMLGLVARWRSLRAAWKAKTVTAEEVREQGRELFEDWYPSLAESAELYRVQCLHCHGVEGGGDGPTAHFLEPHPRDFRHGIFKFTALKDQSRPRREDLLRVLEDGLYGTSMPSFARFSRPELEGLVDYVRLLSVRGEVERRVVDTFVDEGEIPADALESELDTVWGKWLAAASKLIVPSSEVPSVTPELLALGNQLFHDVAKGNCSSCHGDTGRGDGPLAFKVGASGVRVPAYEDAWGGPIRPRDLTTGMLRGGSRPIDIYRRIYAGIPGGPMPALGEAKTATGDLVLSETDLWAIVHYVRSLATRSQD